MDLDPAKHSMVLDLGLLFVLIWLFLGLGVNTVFEGSGDCGSGMKATAELPSRAVKAEPDIVFSCICSNEFMILISFNLILPYM